MDAGDDLPVLPDTPDIAAGAGGSRGLAVTRRQGGRSAGLSGCILLVLLLAAWGFLAQSMRSELREGSLDLLLPVLPAASTPPPDMVIVDIDGAALDRFGPWPWPRARLAELIESVAAADPAVIAIDILLEGPDRFSPSALLELVPDPKRRASLAGVLTGLVEGDVRLREALAIAPTALGIALATGSAGLELPATPILLGASVFLPGLWRADGLIGPESVVAAGAQAFGALVAAADPDGRIRRVPLLVLAGQELRPGLAIEVIRLAQRAAGLVIDASGRLHAGDVVVPLGPDASLRLVQPQPSVWETRTIAASGLLNGSVPSDALTGKIVLIGSSAPELGGLRVTPASPVTPSVQIQAEAIATLLRGGVAIRPLWLGQAEIAGAAVLGLLCLLFALRLRPLLGSMLAVLLCTAWTATGLAAVPAFKLLVDPAGPALVALVTFGFVALLRFSADEWRARLLRASFEQHLSPDVVRRIAADPASLRLKGELREVTAFFTDIEGFTAMTERADPVELVALLDTYFDAVTNGVTEHGGMIDKIVGDAVHALFNAPFSLADHPAKAVACAVAVHQISEEMRASPLGRRLALGRTRIGVETGMAIVGDVGGARKLDYTALGNAVNTAARLEAANKDLGSSICIGPGTAARVDPALLRPIGMLILRGQTSPIRVFTLAQARNDRAG